MNTKQKKTLHLEKLTITRINRGSMHLLRGGDCDVTEPDTGTHWTHNRCDNIF
ncbi:hypothetical protein M0D21_19350 [Aquimarina sp. D1M17]|uniref:hypothetical protein n=1 Tax=Aquimarina acroporae TaxID=2937283 RepID=UPI0020BFB335|nr:hypothetical protein [Aquimarina acroporae]MCK8523747.1 hypothetical protein [Aquimarina acroporae]